MLEQLPMNNALVWYLLQGRFSKHVVALLAQLD